MRLFSNVDIIYVDIYFVNGISLKREDDAILKAIHIIKFPSFNLYFSWINKIIILFLRKKIIMEKKIYFINKNVT